MFTTRSGAVKFSLAIVIGLIVFKVVVGVITGSISVIAQAVDSFLDLLAIAITFFAVIIAIKPADEKHPFGHGKVENIAAIAQAMLIFTAGGLIIYSAVRRIITGATIELTEAGMGVMLVSIIASIFLSRHLLRVSRATDSIALEASARNIAADVYSAAGVLVGLVVIRFTGLSIIDPIIALLVSLIILKAAYDVLRKSFGGLIDVKLPEAEENVIRSAILEHAGELVDFHELRTRKAGSQRYIDLHLVMPKDISVEEAHRMCDHLEQDIEGKLQQASVTIHVEPCSEECKECPVSPDMRKEKP
ncbi:MAG TPA: cation diffusion facilitator family transporter [Dehalococcoidales bacterium]|nr:cation diffusion facilitator family transporter [Dehalococcoidales bacterium]